MKGWPLRRISAGNRSDIRPAMPVRARLTERFTILERGPIPFQSRATEKSRHI
jgi:hypothetical protein